MKIFNKKMTMCSFLTIKKTNDDDEVLIKEKINQKSIKDFSKFQNLHKKTKETDAKKLRR